MIDSHCHLDFPQFDEDRVSVIENARGKGVTHFLIPGTQAKYWQKQCQLAQRHPQLYFALGIHPYFLDGAKEADLDTLNEYLTECRSSVVAVGEIGLDFVVGISQKEQQYFFDAQLELAVSHKLPVIIHHRRSHNQIIRSLKNKKIPRGGVIHAFSGSEQEASSYIELGFLLGAGGTLTYPRASKTRNTLRQVPLENLLLETDSPDMPIYGRQGNRNSPEYLPEILASLSQLREESQEQIEKQTDINFSNLFMSDS